MSTDSLISIQTSLVPWLNVSSGAKAVEFYKKAFNAADVFSMEDDSGSVVARLSVDGAEFWVGDASSQHRNPSPGPDGSSVRLMLTVDDPEAFFKRAVEAGATEEMPIYIEHGWKIGRISDPFGHQWEIGRPFEENSAPQQQVAG